MQQVLRQLNKQSTKISRILSKLSQKYPQISSQIDLALFASIKIQKTIAKYMLTASPSEFLQSTIPQIKQTKTKNQQCDPIFDAALTNIESFKQSTSKLESKINILINQTDTHAKHSGHRRQQHQNRALPKATHNIAKKAKVGVRQTKQIQIEQPSKTLSEMDQSILKLSNQIMTLMQKDQQAGNRLNRSQLSEHSDQQIDY